MESYSSLKAGSNQLFCRLKRQERVITDHQEDSAVARETCLDKNDTRQEAVVKRGVVGNSLKNLA